MGNKSTDDLSSLKIFLKYDNDNNADIISVCCGNYIGGFTPNKSDIQNNNFYC